MELAGLLSLPDEILHNISLYLSVKEILNCSETCHYLRMAFNDNRVWRRFVPVKALQLEVQEQILEPRFQWKDYLTPLCDYRVHYMRLNHLLNNWNSANVVKYTKKTSNSYASAEFNIPAGRGQIIYKDRYIFLTRLTMYIKSDGIEVWDVSKEPFLHSFVNIKNINFDHFYLVGSNLVVVACNKVCVYQINLPENHFPLLYSFIITETEAMRNKDIVHRELCDSCCVGWSSYNIGQYLVCNRSGDEGSIIHVWDILNATKVGAFALPIDARSVSVEAHEEDEWLLGSFVQPLDFNCYLLFNIKTTKFAKTVFKINFSIAPCKKSILYRSNLYVFSNYEKTDGQCKTTCAVYDFKMSAKVKKKIFIDSFKRKTYIYSIIIVNGSFILIINDCLMKIDAITLETIDVVQCGLFVGNTYQLSVFGSFFIVSCKTFKMLELWSVTKKNKVKHSCESTRFSNSLPF